MKMQSIKNINPHNGTITLSSVKLIGITIKTNNKHEIGENESKICKVVQKYFGESFAEKIEERKNPGITYCAYTDYENGIEGDYTFFIGEIVDEFP